MRRHDNVIQAIQNLISDGENEGAELNFELGSYLDAQNQVLRRSLRSGILMF